MSREGRGSRDFFVRSCSIRSMNWAARWTDASTPMCLWEVSPRANFSIGGVGKNTSFLVSRHLCQEQSDPAASFSLAGFIIFALGIGVTSMASHEGSDTIFCMYIIRCPESNNIPIKSIRIGQNILVIRNWARRILLTFSTCRENQPASTIRIIVHSNSIAVTITPTSHRRPIPAAPCNCTC